MDAAIIEEYREIIEAVGLTDEVTVWKSLTGSQVDPTAASDGRGGVNLSVGGASEGYVQGNVYPCRLLIQGPSAGQGEKSVSEGYYKTNMSILAVPHNAEITVSDRVEVYLRNSDRTIMYDVLNLTQHTDMLTKKYALQEVQNAN